MLYLCKGKNKYRQVFLPEVPMLLRVYASNTSNLHTLSKCRLESQVDDNDGGSLRCCVGCLDTQSNTFIPYSFLYSLYLINEYYQWRAVNVTNGEAVGLLSYFWRVVDAIFKRISP